MKINEVISRRDAEQRFAQMVNPREIEPAPPAPEPTTKTHTVKKLPKHVEPERGFAQINTDQDRKVHERIALSKELEKLAPRAMMLEKKNYQTIPANVIQFDYKPWINDYSYSVEGRLDTTICILKKVIASLKQYIQYPNRVLGTINTLSDLISLEDERRRERLAKK